MRIFNKFIEDPGVLFSYLFGSLYFWIYKLTNDSLKSKKITIIGVPILDIRKNSKVVIGNNVLLRSRNRGYHINLLSSCKLMPDSGGFIYIGDNTKKDFIAPNKLGWETICLRDNGLNIHQQNFNLDSSFLPKYMINNLAEIVKIVNDE